MKAIRATINKSTLLFLRNSLGVTFEYLARVSAIKEDNLKIWEDIASPKLPTINQAKKVAKCLRIPFAGLYMDSKDIDVGHIPKRKNLRTLHGATAFDDSALNLAIIDLLNARELLLSTQKELGESVSAFTIDLSTTNVICLANAIRANFNILIEEQYRLASSRQFYLYVRNKIEERGVFVHGFTGVDIETARGISIFNDVLPTIGVNDKDRYPAKTFTMIHELVHIIKCESTTCNDMFRSSINEEVFCNAVAGEVLVPQEALRIVLNRFNEDLTESNVADIANTFSVSKEVIIRRLLDLSYITPLQYDTLSIEFDKTFKLEKEEQKKQREESGIKGIPQNKVMQTIDKTSTRLCRTLFIGVSEGVINKLDVSRYLSIDYKHIDRFMREVSKWSN